MQEEGHPAYIPAVIIGTGIDLVEIPRMTRIRERHGRRGLDRLFTRQEVDYCLALVTCDASLAARVAAKEAFYKAIGTGRYEGGLWRDVEVVRLRTGAPALRLHGSAAAHAKRRGVSRLHLALSHVDGLAVAQVVLEG
ncbi:MAG TPA: holo-ACP synthase [Longimicrobiales bacterium]|nr:holo-ACP synthase [Longimicrobiales bacterium]